VMGILMDYSWPGNIRELQNVLERAIVLATGRTIDLVDLPEPASRSQSSEHRAAIGATLDEWLKDQERKYIAEKLDAFGGNVGMTAKSCGIGLRTLSRKLQIHGLDRKQFKQKTRSTKTSAANVVGTSRG
jgi:DNA-binding NtrC family response regulator